MSATTPRYDITYPTRSDLVSQAPTQFKQLAESVESALGEVDDRQTANAVKPVVRSTLAQLAGASAVTGQTGYVTADSTSANNGAYVYNGSAWVKYAMKSDVDDLADQITQGYESGIVVGSTSSVGAIGITWSRHSTQPKAVFVGFAPTTVESVKLNFTPILHSVESENCQVRLLDNRLHSWAGAQPVSLYWLAIW